MEYKSPGDHLDVDAFYKAGAYASLYKSYGETSDERKVEDITVSIVREAKPEGLFQWLHEHKVTIANPHHGIYYILDGVLFPTQIIVTGELDRENHTWLKALSGKMKRQDMEKLLERITNLTHKYDKELADSVLEVTARANMEIIEELRGDDDMCNALLEIMAPEIEERVKAGEVRGETRGEIRGEIRAFRKCGYSDEEIKNILLKEYDLTIEEIESYLKVV